MEPKLGFRDTVEVSALVSTYDAGKYMEACLEDLIAQSHYQAGKVEIIVVDCNSPGNETEIVRRYQESHPRISYVRITERETLAGAWNIGAKYAEGEFLTNANTDDRHHPECYERLSKVLRENESIDLVYADVFESRTPNETFDENKQTVLYKYPDYFAPDVFMLYQFGCQPMWRASLHDKIGFFNRELKAASDYDFNFRFALAGCRARHLAEPLGLFLERDDSLSLGDKTSVDEQAQLRKKYLNVDNILAMYDGEGWDISSDEGKVKALHDLSIRASRYEMPWKPFQQFQDAEVALGAVMAALNFDQENPALLNNFAALLMVVGRVDQAKQVLGKLTGASHLEPICSNLERVATGEVERVPLALCADLVLETTNP